LNLNSSIRNNSIERLKVPPEFGSGGLLYFLSMQKSVIIFSWLKKLSAKIIAMQSWYYPLFQGGGDA